MDFGIWLREQRTKRDFDLQTMSGYSLIDTSTISRIENGRTQATLRTALRLCLGMRVPIEKLVEDLTGTPIKKRPQLVNKDNYLEANVLTRYDANGFADLLRFSPETGGMLFAKLLTDVITEQASREGRQQPPAINASEITRFFSDSTVVRYEISYPDKLDHITIFKIFQDNGVLTYKDVGVYLRGLRKMQKRTLADFQRVVKQSASVLSRLETGNLENIKLKSILSLDQHLSMDYEILQMYWAATSFQLSSSSVRKTGVSSQATTVYAVVFPFINICRWLQYQHGNDFSWLKNLRRVNQNQSESPNLP